MIPQSKRHLSSNVLVVLAALLLVFLADIRAVRACEDYTLYNHWLAGVRWLWRGMFVDYAIDVDVSGEFAFAATANNGLQIIWIAEPGNPVNIAGVRLPHAPLRITAHNGLVFCATGNGGLRIVDVTDPKRPLIAGGVGFLSYASSVAARGDWVYVAIGSFGVAVVNASDPRVPVHVRTMNTPGSAAAVSVAGDLLMIADQTGGLLVALLAEPDNPKLAGIFSTASPAYEVTASYDHAYVLREGAVMEIVDVRTPSAPQLLGAVDLPYNSKDVAVVGAVAYVAAMEEGLIFVDVSDPANPKRTAAIDIYEEANFDGLNRLAVQDGFAYACAEYRGLQILEVGKPPRNPPEIASVAIPGRACDVAAGNGYAYVASHNKGLQVVDVSVPETPRIVYAEQFGLDRIIRLKGDLLFKGWSTSFYCYDVSDPRNPRYLDGLYCFHGWTGMAAGEDYLYIAQGEPRLLVVDYRDPSKLRPVGRVQLMGKPTDVVLADSQYAYVGIKESGENDGIAIVDVSDPYAPVLAGEFHGLRGGYAISFHLDGDHLYVSNRGLELIDITNRLSPVVVSAVDAPPGGGYDVAVHDGIAYLAKGIGDLVVYDFRNPGQPELLGYSELPDEARSVAIVDDLVLVADYYGGLRIIDLQCPILEDLTPAQTPGPASLLAQNYPNPFNPTTTIEFELPAPRPVTLTIYAVDGHRVATLIDAEELCGRHTIAWDGRDDRGVPVASGVYFYKLESAGFGGTKKMVLLR